MVHTSNSPSTSVHAGSMAVLTLLQRRRERSTGARSTAAPRNRHGLLGSFSNWMRSHQWKREKHPGSCASFPPSQQHSASPTWRRRGWEKRNKKTSIRVVIAARLADVLFGMALGFSAEFGRNTPTGAS